MLTRLYKVSLFTLLAVEVGAVMLVSRSRKLSALLADLDTVPFTEDL
jgi:hypothetical protein